MKMMVEVDITDEIKEKARSKTLEMPTLKDSVTENGRVYIGFVGEEVANLVLKGSERNTYDYDLILDNGKTVDVKSKKISRKPLPHYEVSIYGFNTRQQCDYYAFVMINEELGKAWFVGTYPKQDYFRDARFIPKGSVEGPNKLTFKSNCYNMPISQLKGAIE